ncbi:hypothetical protein EUTSA_v10002518mg [Eutrema salsugineum]|uniref:F-box domain-containing protein n=1 Tax=Eutrema salsugineum TaxID=72664 RepID=V4L1N4_EUTSA|nr:F-box/FBD/LRR-repeat protein At5g22660 [Eutrema salsugineum]XP_024009227.1 F-box/FBD/LRR-repeat protein At5g22660 [Eutrema salsugineum]ESQ37539.1 hypothetical protein EUTSA_v10002518mg [Eutrema salsugineum]
MIDFLTEKPVSSKREGRRHGGEDRISLLPDPLLCQILSNLPTKDAVKTSLLSSKWRYIWLSISELELDDEEFANSDSFVSFVDRFIDFSVESPIEKLKLKLTSKREKCSPFAINSWVDAAVKRNIQHLEIDYAKRYLGFELLSTDIFICQTLVCLRLRFVALNDFERVSLPRLKTMHLEEVRFVNHLALETLVASCPVLEDLSVIRSQDDVKVLRVCSQTINRLILVLDVAELHRNRWANSDVVIDAPKLKYLSIKDNQSTSFTIVNSLCSSAEVDIAVDFNVKDVLNINDSGKRSSIGCFLARISSVRDMTICWKTFKVIRHYCKLEPLPQFCYMSQLHAKIFAVDLEMLPDLLESCPNLKYLVLELNGSIKKDEQMSFSSSVPLCLRSCLEHVEMRKPISGFGVEMELIRYFLENSTVLKKLTLRLGCPRMKQESIIFKELLGFRRCSSACVVDVVGLEETLMKL